MYIIYYYGVENDIVPVDFYSFNKKAELVAKFKELKRIYGTIRFYIKFVDFGVPVKVVNE